MRWLTGFRHDRRGLQFTPHASRSTLHVSFWRDRRGSQLIEFILVIPFFILVLWNGFTVVQILDRQRTLQWAAQETARCLALSVPDPNLASSGELRRAIEAHCQRVAENELAIHGLSGTWEMKPQYGSREVPDSPCGTPLTVTLTYQPQGATWWLWPAAIITITFSAHVVVSTYLEQDCGPTLTMPAPTPTPAPTPVAVLEPSAKEPADERPLPR